MELITRRVIKKLEGDREDVDLTLYSDPKNSQYQEMVHEIGKELNFTSLRYHRLDDMIQSVGIDPSKLCTYCWNGQE